MRNLHFNRVNELVLSATIALTLVGCKSECQQECLRDAPYSARVVYNDTNVNSTIATKNMAYGIMSDNNPIQIAICEQVLNGCIEADILDRKGVKVYRKIAKHPSVARYMELIEECENETVFYDTVGECDAWLDYCDYVLAPRGLAD